MIISKIKNYLKEIRNRQKEILWSVDFNTLRMGGGWLKDLPPIAPGRWAVGYNYLYVISRILDAIKPHDILDLGLGISSTIFTSYLNYMKFDSCNHIIIEEDKNWESFYNNIYKLSKYSSIKILDTKNNIFDKHEYNCYNGFYDYIKNYKFQLLSIDGPKGSEHHSRRDIIDCVPNVLYDDFVIVFDDAQRKGEIETINELIMKLNENNIEHCIGTYHSIKNVVVICSKSFSFLCSL